MGHASRVLRREQLPDPPAKWSGQCTSTTSTAKLAAASASPASDTVRSASTPRPQRFGSPCPTRPSGRGWDARTGTPDAPAALPPRSGPGRGGQLYSTMGKTNTASPSVSGKPPEKELGGASASRDTGGISLVRENETLVSPRVGKTSALLCVAGADATGVRIMRGGSGYPFGSG